MEGTYPGELDLLVYLGELAHLIPQLSARLMPLGPEEQGEALVRRRLLQLLQLLQGLNLRGSRLLLRGARRVVDGDPIQKMISETVITCYREYYINNKSRETYWNLI